MRTKRKAILSMILAIIAVSSVVVPVSAARQYGDINYDGKITAADSRLALRAAVGLIQLTGDDLTAADVDKNGKVGTGDARLILRWAIGADYEENVEFNKALYEVAHPLIGSYKPAFATGILKNFQKWCCYYTIHDVFRPTLEKLNYPKAKIDLIAPDHYEKEDLAKAIKNGAGISNYPSWMIADSMAFYVPSLLMNHYYKHPEVCDVYNFYDYYDDVVTLDLFYRDSDDVESWHPRVGDVLFMSNKTRTYSNGYPTIDHTAQILEVYDDGTFKCTEGSLIEEYEGDGIAKVRERTYHYNPDVGTWEFDYNPVVIVLTAVRPYL